jgi:hypothetical protein
MKVGITIPMRRKTNRNMVRPSGLDSWMNGKNATGDEGS